MTAAVGALYSAAAATTTSLFRAALRHSASTTLLTGRRNLLPPRQTRRLYLLGGVTAFRLDDNANSRSAGRNYDNFPLGGRTDDYLSASRRDVLALGSHSSTGKRRLLFGTFPSIATTL